MATDRSADPPVPHSGAQGIAWPAVPRAGDAYVLSLLYQFERTQWWTPDQLIEHQLDQLHVLLRHAYGTAPFYRERLAEIAALPREDLTLDRLRVLPLLTKDDLRTHSDSLQTQALPERHGPVHELFTSGSTGSPVRVVATQVTEAFHAAISLRRLFWHGRDLSAKAARISALKPGDSMPPDGGRANGWAPAYPTGPLVTLNVLSTVAEQVAWLIRERSAYLMTLPTVLAEILRYCEARGERLDFITGVGTVTEMPPPGLREDCDRVLGLPLVDTYSANEVGNIAVQCPVYAHYHVQVEDVLVEILDESGKPCAPGEPGRVVVTDLHNFAMPIIRYDIGDFAEPGEPCPCGRGLPVLNRVVGRARNMLTLPTGDRIWPMVGMALRLDVPVQNFQIVQKDLESLEVRIVSAQPLNEVQEDGVRASLHEWIGTPFRIYFSYVDEIPRGPGGKYEDFISEVT